MDSTSVANRGTPASTSSPAPTLNSANANANNNNNNNSTGSNNSNTDNNQSLGGVLNYNDHQIPNYTVTSADNDEPPPSYEEAVNSTEPPIEQNLRRPHVPPPSAASPSPVASHTSSHLRPSAAAASPAPAPAPAHSASHSPSLSATAARLRPVGSSLPAPSPFGGIHINIPGAYQRPGPGPGPGQYHRQRHQQPSTTSGATNQISSYTPWIYPPGYYCYKCRNTGIKLKNGLQCKDCWEFFATRSRYVKRITSIPRNAMLNRSVLRPGDPAIGGFLCGRCRGVGTIDLFLFEDMCPVCGGIGRVQFA